MNIKQSKKILKLLNTVEESIVPDGVDYIVCSEFKTNEACIMMHSSKYMNMIYKRLITTYQYKGQISAMTIMNNDEPIFCLIFKF